MIASDPAGNAFVVRAFDGTIDLDPGPGEALLTNISAPRHDDLTAFTVDGIHAWVLHVGSGNALAHRSFESLTLAGDYGDKAELEPGPGEFIHSSGAGRILITRIGDLPSDLPVGLVDTSQGRWYLRGADGTVRSFHYGNPGDCPLMGEL